MLGEIAQELSSDLARSEIVFRQQRAPLRPTFVRAVEAQQALHETHVVRETLVRETVETEIELRLEALRIGARVLRDELTQISLNLLVVHLREQFAREFF